MLLGEEKDQNSQRYENSVGLSCFIFRERVVPRRTVVGTLIDVWALMMTPGCRNASQCHQQQSFSGLLSPRQLDQTNALCVSSS